jgi:hypothetical protein
MQRCKTDEAFPMVTKQRTLLKHHIENGDEANGAPIQSPPGSPRWFNGFCTTLKQAAIPFEVAQKPSSHWGKPSGDRFQELGTADQKS